MARIYNTRQLLDPRYVEMMNQNIDNRLATSRQDRAEMTKMLTNAGLQLGKSLEDSYNEYNRRKAVGVKEDPVYNAAADQYARTGDASGLLQYRSMIEAQKAKEEEAKRREAERKYQEQRNADIRFAEARDKYDQYVMQYNNAIDKGDFSTAQYYKNRMQAIENKFGSDRLGDTVESMAAARQKDIEERQAKAADEKTLELAKEQQKKDSLNKRLSIESNVLPNAASFEDKTNYKKMVKTLHENGKLTDEDANLLFKEIDATETIGEKKRKAVEGAQASKAGEATGTAIDESKELYNLAKIAKEKMEKGYNLSSKEQEAYDKVYGGK